MPVLIDPDPSGVAAAAYEPASLTHSLAYLTFENPNIAVHGSYLPVNCDRCGWRNERFISPACSRFHHATAPKLTVACAMSAPAFKNFLGCGDARYNRPPPCLFSGFPKVYTPRSLPHWHSSRHATFLPTQSGLTDTRCNALAGQRGLNAAGSRSRGRHH